MAIIDAGVCRDDWEQNPYLSESEQARLSTFSNDQIEQALRAAMDDRFWTQINSLVGDATRTLLGPDAPRRICPRCSGDWGQDETCRLCSTGDGEARNPAEIVSTQMRIWHDLDVAAASSADDALVQEIDERDDVLCVTYFDPEPYVAPVTDGAA